MVPRPRHLSVGFHLIAEVAKSTQNERTAQIR
jgi:hypothetical protein